MKDLGEDCEPATRSEQKSDPIFTFRIQESDNNVISDVFEKSSSLNRIISVIAYNKRFINNSHKRKSSDQSYLNAGERQIALCTILLAIQNSCFAKEIQAIRENVPISFKVPLISLNIFVEEYGVLRVRGQLQNASLPFQAKYPVILPASHKIIYLLIREYHVANLHAGPILLSNVLRQKFGS
ncbi:hypothetical protein AVEN_263513-1 [Araneus ventricosus]|uniref:Uncharacterized protein n=1 Tax=Araneus ventricosus TaxID=182803 RepID=A0A4Y2EYC4_ARAVE|nr:hypothetical protein AVEN_263513-1 [Araneus ventricosus]